MKLIATLPLLLSASVMANTTDPVEFVKKMPYTQVVKDMVFARCISQVADENSQISLDAARTANALREWIPYDIENGDEKVNALISQFKDTINGFHSESAQSVKGVTLNCLRLYHSKELTALVPKVLSDNPNRTWLQDNSAQK